MTASGASTLLNQLWRSSGGYSRSAAYLAALLIAAPTLYHIANSSTAYLGLLEDDHFYYAGVADRVIALGRLTYDGATLTNGFHPLWLMVIAMLRWVTGGLGPGFYVGLTLVAVASMLWTYELGWRFARQLGASPVLAAAVVAIYSVGTARLLATGMECVVAVPLLLWWFLEIARLEGAGPGVGKLSASLTPRRCMWLGFLASLAILGRLDVAIAVALTIVGYMALVRPAAVILWRQLAAFAVGGFLVPAYAIANFIYFNTALPVSALAKRLTTSMGFSIPYARAAALETYYGPTIGMVLPLGVIALIALYRRGRRPSFSGAVALAFAFSFFFLNALSGWIFFGWYAYPLAPATIAALVFICQWLHPRVPRQAAQAVLLLLVGLAPVMAARYYIQHGPKWSISDNTLLAMSYDLATHLKGHDGLPAMGACAGVAAHVAQRPMLQIEGIIADRRLVEHVRRQSPLEDVLREYHADYLIVSLVGVPPRRENGCYVVTQPDAEWAGNRTAKMSGEICSEPVEHFFTEAGTHPWSSFPRVETFVWDLRSAQWHRRLPHSEAW